MKRFFFSFLALGFLFLTLFAQGTFAAPSILGPTDDAGIGNSDSVVIGPCASGTGVAKFGSLCSASRPENIPTVLFNTIVAVFVIASILALFFLIWGGFKWLSSGGDKGKIDAARNTIIAAIVGLILTFLSFFIISLVLGFFGLSLNNLAIPTLPK